MRPLFFFSQANEINPNGESHASVNVMAFMFIREEKKQTDVFYGDVEMSVVDVNTKCSAMRPGDGLGGGAGGGGRDLHE